MFLNIEDDLSKYSIKLLCYLCVTFSLYWATIGSITPYWIFMIAIQVFGIISYIAFKYLVFNNAVEISTKMITIGVFIALVAVSSYYFNENLDLAKANAISKKFENYDNTIDSLNNKIIDYQHKIDQLDSILYNSGNSQDAIDYLKKVGLLK